MLKKILAVAWFLAAVVGIWKGDALADQMKIGRSGGVLASSQISQIIDKGVSDFIVIDIRDPWDFEEGHIRGAKNYSLEFLEGQKSSFLPAKSYIVTGDDSRKISEVVRYLKERNLTVFVHQGGMADWTESGLSVAAD